MAAPKRTELEREAQLPEIEKLHNRGYSNREVAARFGLTEGTIRRDLETIKQRYREETLCERTEGVNRMLASLRDARREAWEAWERSKENKEKQVKEKVSETLGPDGKPTAETVQKMKAVVTSEGRLPGSEYLNIILKTYEEEIRLLGLYAPTKVAPTTPDGEDSYNPDRDGGLGALADEIRAYREQQRAGAAGQARGSGTPSTSLEPPAGTAGMGTGESG